MVMLDCFDHLLVALVAHVVGYRNVAVVSASNSNKHQPARSASKIRE